MDDPAPRVATARLVVPIWLTAAHVTLIVATALFAAPVNGGEAQIFFATALSIFGVLPLLEIGPAQ